MRGRKPKPTWKKKLTGNPGKRKLNRNEPTPPAGTPDCPPHLDKVAKEEWKKITALLSKMRILTEADRAALTIYCQNWSRMIEAQKAVEEEGAIVLTEKGFPVQNPWLSIANQAMKQLKTIMVELGLTPSSRSRIEIPPEKVANPFTDFLSEDQEG